MIVSAILKAIFFYFTFVFIRKLIQGHKHVKAMNERMQQAQNAQYENRYNHAHAEAKSYAGGDTIEAQYRKLDD